MPFTQTLREEFGRDAASFYSADTFNEMMPPTDDPVYLSNVSSAVYQVCSPTLAADEINSKASLPGNGRCGIVKECTAA